MSTATPTQPAAPMSEADRAAHEAASYVRRPEPTPDLPPLPVEPAARRRALKIRGW
ncbi:hypothetical protein [Streptomyces sp. NPDC050564]|uniref:hypothetical protein n=1 Tax=Streptomyces sp. NPDC050564 TaxID=3365631 RepID=UPI00378FB27E